MRLLRLVPPVLRAREFRLYTQGGGRLTDLWQEGGRAILGHTPAGVLRELKNTANRGLSSPFPHPLARRFEKALARLFPGRLFRVYAPGTAIRTILDAAGVSSPQAILWRPFDGASVALPSVLVPVLPGWSSPPIVLAIDPAFEEARPFPPSDIISPIILAAAARGLYDLIAASPERGRAPFPKTCRAIPQSHWQRQGIYLRYEPRPAGEAYTVLFRHFLEGGFLLPPDPRLPLILPGLLSPGEDARLAGLLLFHA
jgi:hypothetical protein